MNLKKRIPRLLILIHSSPEKAEKNERNNKKRNNKE
jgi:hypothetical protein